MKKILVVIGTRPNFIKITQFRKVAEQYSDKLEVKFVHTGQHYDHKMSTIFFEQFGLRPDFFLELEARTPISQISEIMLKCEALFSEYKPDLVMVPGDVNSTLAAAICANKMEIKLAHIESGLRSFDREMPEEHNRVLTDEISDILLVTEESGLENLEIEGKIERAIHVGNTMIDTIVGFSEKIEESSILEDLGVEKRKFVLMTTHRPSNVDHLEGLKKLIQTIESITKKFKAVFPIHPRTLNRAKEFGLHDKLTSLEGLILLEPLDYFAFQKLTKYSFMVLTDSGGIQEETTFYQTPCLTIRENTERPSTITQGSNELIKFEPAIIEEKMNEMVAGKFKPGSVPKYWDGKATERIFEHLSKVL